MVGFARRGNSIKDNFKEIGGKGHHLCRRLGEASREGREILYRMSFDGDREGKRRFLTVYRPPLAGENSLSNGK